MKGDCEAISVPVYLCEHEGSSSRNSLLMDTTSFLNAFSRMVPRRGKTEVMISDGTNFTSAERELLEVVSTLDQTWIKEQVAHDGIQ